MPDIFDSIVLITSADTSNKKFGSGFAIRREQDMTWIVTCAHVVEDVGGAGCIQIDGRPAEILACGKSDEIDLAVLRVAGLGSLPLALGLTGKDGLHCTITGYASLNSGSPLKRAESLQGTLGYAELKHPDGTRIEAWRLWIDSKILLEGGYSGSPVIDTASGLVFAVTSHSIAKGESGYAISLANLAKIWPEMPSDLLQASQATSTVFPAQLEDLSNFDLEQFNTCRRFFLKPGLIGIAVADSTDSCLEFHGHLEKRLENMLIAHGRYRAGVKVERIPLNSTYLNVENAVKKVVQFKHDLKDHDILLIIRVKYEERLSRFWEMLQNNFNESYQCCLVVLIIKEDNFNSPLSLTKDFPAPIFTEDHLLDWISLITDALPGGKAQKADLKAEWLEFVMQRCAINNCLHTDQIYQTLAESLTYLRRNTSLIAIQTLLHDWREEQRSGNV